MPHLLGLFEDLLGLMRDLLEQAPRAELRGRGRDQGRQPLARQRKAHDGSRQTGRGCGFPVSTATTAALTTLAETSTSTSVVAVVACALSGEGGGGSDGGSRGLPPSVSSRPSSPQGGSPWRACCGRLEEEVAERRFGESRACNVHNHAWARMGGAGERVYS